MKPLLAPARRTACILALVLLFGSGALTAQSLAEWRAMNRPVEPFRIMGNLYYVGANSVTAFLITTPEGHILIDGGFEETVPIIEAGVKKLGFDLSDVKILLNSHAHGDHAGGLAALQEKTGARVLASIQDKPLLERGGREDDLMGDAFPYPSVKVDRALRDGDTVELGGVRLTARVTAGHTRGCTSWVFEVPDGKARRLAVSVCSLTILPGTRLVTDPTYPGIAEDYSRSLEILESLPCELFLASHAGFFDMETKRARLEDGDETAFLDPEGYRSYLSRARKRFEDLLTEQMAQRGE